MKKILLLLMSVLIIGWMCRTTIHADDYESLNYINPALFTEFSVDEAYYDMYAQLEVGPSGFIPIKSGVEYFFMPTYVNKQTNLHALDWSALPQFDHAPQIELFDENHASLGTLTPLKTLSSMGIACGYAFQVATGVAYIKISNILLTSTMMESMEFCFFYEEECLGIDSLLLLMEADKTKYLPTNSSFDYDTVRGLSSYDITRLSLGENLQDYCYGESFWDYLSPVLDTNAYSFTTTVDDPIGLLELQNELCITAYDEIDGNITSAIQISATLYETSVLEVPMIKNRSLGNYVVTFSVADGAGNSSSMQITLHVVDHEQPVLNVEDSIICYHREVDAVVLTIEQIIANIHVIDNYSEVTIVETVNHFTGHETEKGEFIVTLTYEDTSHNQMDVTVTIMNEDHTIPDITSALTLHSVSYTYTGDIHSILNTFQISVIDNYDGALDYMIVADTYTPNASYVGHYTVTIQAIDSSGNINTATYQIDVIDDVPPYFYIDNNIVTVNVGELLSTKDIMTLLKVRKLTKPMSFSIDIVQDDYTENRHQAGEYEMVIDIQYENGEVEQKVLIFKVEQSSPSIPKGFFANLWLQIKKILLWLWNIIKWPFVQLWKLF